MKKLKPSIIAAIQAAKRNGATTRELAERFTLSKGSIDNALKTPVTKPHPRTAKPHPASQVPAVGADEPMTREELVSFLTTQARALKADITIATEPAMRAALNRQLVAVQMLLSRTLPPSPIDPNVGVFVKAEEMAGLACQVGERLKAMVDIIASSAESGPPCPMCKRPLADTEVTP